MISKDQIMIRAMSARRKGTGGRGVAVWVTAAVLVAVSLGQVPTSTVHVSDHWPLGKASTLLERHYGVPISYEDLSVYEYEGELRELDNFAESLKIHPNMKRILFPNGVLDFSFPEPVETATPASVAGMLTPSCSARQERQSGAVRAA